MKYNCTPLQARLRLTAPNALQLGNRMSDRSEMVVGEARFVSSWEHRKRRAGRL